jgi:choline dehydrogenase
VTAEGVHAISEGGRHYFSGEHVVLAAGAINSPAILLRSGIGGARKIELAGGKPVLDLPGVGSNLMDHPAVIIWGVPRPGACREGESVHEAMLQEKTSGSNALCDLQLFMLSAVPTPTFPSLQEAAGSAVAVGISVVVATPRSKGRVELLDRNPAQNPRIYLNCVSEESDLRRMMQGVRLAWRMLQEKQLDRSLDRIVLWSQSIIDSDRLLMSVIRSAVRGTWHPAGTLRMGDAKDALAVVDQAGRLHGARNVTVADASIMPVIPSVPTNLTCMLIGERIAAELCGSG